MTSISCKDLGRGGKNTSYFWGRGVSVVVASKVLVF